MKLTVALSSSWWQVGGGCGGSLSLFVILLDFKAGAPDKKVF
jgi:hypothetical protein